MKGRQKELITTFHGALRHVLIHTNWDQESIQTGIKSLQFVPCRKSLYCIEPRGLLNKGTELISKCRHRNKTNTRCDH